MPYVAESYSAPARDIIVYDTDNDGPGGAIRRHPYKVVVPGRESKTQYGYRSGPVSREELARELSRTSDRYRVLGGAGALDDWAHTYEFGHSKPRKFGVNDRDFSKSIIHAVRSGCISDHYHTQWRRQVTRSNEGAWWLEAGAVELESDLEQFAQAGKQLRRIAPTQPDVSLVAALGEARELPDLVKVAHYLPRSSREAAGSFLNWTFGVKPTVSEVQELALIMHTSTSRINALVASERRKLRRSGVTERITDSRQVQFHAANAPSTVTVNVPGGKLVYGRGFGPWQDVLLPAGAAVAVNLEVSSIVTRGIRSFATYEYFIPRPVDISTRLKRYRATAEHLLGGGLKESDVWQLTPWSWAVDWFIDVGGLLQYQEAVRKNNIVCTRGGSTLYVRHALSASVLGYTILRHPMRPAESETWTFRMTGSSAAYSEFTRERRRAGSPYSFAPDWTFSGQRAAIVTALGMSRR